MSEQSQGPGWWQASDGKWYRPEQHPDYRPPAPPPPAATPQRRTRRPGFRPSDYMVAAVVVATAVFIGAFAVAKRRADRIGAATSTASTPVTGGLSPSQWVAVARPYALDVADVDNQLAASARIADLEGVKSASGKLADAIVAFRLAFEGAWPPPAQIVVEAQAVLDAAIAAEHASRAVASCTGTADCASKITKAATAESSFTAAVAALEQKS